MTAVAFSIAGSDPSGGAGIQADLKTFHQHGVYGTAALTLLTVQNTLGVADVSVLPAEFVEAQIQSVLADFPVAAVKTGALGTVETVSAVAGVCVRAGLRPVVDPVRISKAGAPLVDGRARDTLRSELLPQASVVTPNLDEAAWLLGLDVEEIQSLDAMRSAAEAIGRLGVGAVLVKGGHLPGEPCDVLWHGGHVRELAGVRVDTVHTHGVGCALSAAICSGLALGKALDVACVDAKAWLQRAIEQAPGLGRGQGPIGHGARVT